MVAYAAQAQRSKPTQGSTASMLTLAAKRGVLENQRRLEKKRIARRQWDMLIEKVAGRYFDKSLRNRYI
jgi:hypothetical protein